jgi:hypothetical protein
MFPLGGTPIDATLSFVGHYGRNRECRHVSRTGTANKCAHGTLGDATRWRIVWRRHSAALQHTVAQRAELHLELGHDAGQRYQVEYKNVLTAPTWTPLGSEVLGNGSTFSVTNSSPIRPAVFPHPAVVKKFHRA